MQRTQVYFDEEVLDNLREEARRKGITLASIIRERVNKSTKKNKKKVKKMNAAEFLTGLAKLGQKLNVKGPKDLSQRIDEYVYRYPNPIKR